MKRPRRVSLHIVLFEVCSAFTHVAACTLARSPIRGPLSEGFSHFVTSMTAPVASGWSGCRVGLIRIPGEGLGLDSCAVAKRVGWCAMSRGGRPWRELLVI